MGRVLKSYGVLLLGSTLVFAGCAGGGSGSGGSSQILPERVGQRTAFVSSIQDELNAAHGFPSVSLHAMLAQRAPVQNSVKPPATNLIYSGDFDNNVITYFPMKGINQSPLGQITNGLNNPERLFVDAKLNVYATNLGNSSIVAYKNGGTSPFLTITTGVSNPTGLVVDKNGTVYCANVGNDTITEYAAGKTSPSVTINLGTNAAEYLAIGPSGDLYASILGGPVMRFKPGASTGTTLNLEVGSAGAIELDKLGNILLLDENSSTLDVFPRGKTKPSKTIAVGGYPFALAMNGGESQVYVSAIPPAGGWVIQQLAYPAGKAFVNKITSNINGWPIAASPDNVL